MRGGASKTPSRARRGVCRVSPPPTTTTVYAAALPAGGTLRDDARAVVAAARDDPDDPPAGVPRAVPCGVGGARGAERGSGDRRVSDALTDGETLVLADDAFVFCRRSRAAATTFSVRSLGCRYVTPEHAVVHGVCRRGSLGRRPGGRRRRGPRPPCPGREAAIGTITRIDLVPRHTRARREWISSSLWLDTEHISSLSH